MKEIKRHRNSLILLLISFVTLLSCDRTRNQKGYEYFPDMAHSYAYETYTPNPVFQDGKTMQAPPEGTVSREMIPYMYPATIEGRTQAGADLKNPLEVEKMHIEKGKYLYEIFCQGCHGVNGTGEGHLYTSDKYAIKPASLVNEKMKNVPEGEIYHVITAGYGVMGAHGSQINSDDRWEIVLYLKNELQKMAPVGNDTIIVE
ncbi:c-type cytochrome [candidate division KSB1 bacterium]